MVRGQLDENNFCHYYGISFESIRNYLIAAMSNILLQQLQGTFTTTFEMIHYNQRFLRTWIAI